MSGEPGLSFWQAVGLAVIDKALLAGVGVWLGHFLNKKLEVFRVRQSQEAELSRERRAFQADFLRERTKRLDELYGLMGTVRETAGAYVTAAHKSRSLRDGPVTARLAASLSRRGGEWEAFKDAGQALTARAARFRPWIGLALAEACVHFSDEMMSSALEETFPGAPHDTHKIDEIEKSLDGLEKLLFAEIRQGAPTFSVKVP